MRTLLSLNKLMDPKWVRRWPSLLVYLFPSLALLGLSSIFVSYLPGHSGDSIEFQFLALTGGVAHPPGAPLYVFLLRLWYGLFPWSSPALAANYFSVVAAIGVAFFSLRLLAHLGQNRLSLWLFSFFLLPFPLWIRLSNVAELYVPALLFGVWALERCEVWAQGGRNANLVAVGWLLGLGAGIHPMVLLFGPPCLMVVLKRERKPWLNLGAWFALCSLLVGILVNCAMVIGLALDESTTFVWAPLSSTEEMLTFLTAKSFRANAWSYSLDELLTARLPMYLKTIFSTSPAMLLFFAVGGVAAFKRPGAWVFVVVVLINVVYVIPYDVWDVWDFVLPGYWGCCMIAAMGATWLTKEFCLKSRWRWVLGGVLALLIPIQILSSVPGNKIVREELVNPYWQAMAKTLISTAGNNSIIVSSRWDKSCALWYEAFVNADQENNFVVAHNPGRAEVVRFIQEKSPLDISNERRTIENTGQKVFVVGQAETEAYVQHGISGYKIINGFYLISDESIENVQSQFGDREIREMTRSDPRVVFDQGWGGGESWGRWLLEEQGSLVVSGLEGSSRLIFKASLWGSNQPPVTAEVYFQGRFCGSVVVNTPPWQMKEFSIDLDNRGSVDSGIIEVKVGEQFGQPGDRKRSLPVSDLWVVNEPLEESHSVE